MSILTATEGVHLSWYFQCGYIKKTKTDIHCCESLQTKTHKEAEAWYAKAKGRSTDLQWGNQCEGKEWMHQKVHK